MLLYLIRSLSLYFIWDMASFFSFLFSFFQKQWTFMCPLFFTKHSLCVSSYNQYLERDILNLKTWSIYMVEMDGMFLRTSNVEAAYICGVCVILILGLWHNSQLGSQGLTKLNTSTSSIYRRVLNKVWTYMAVVGILLLLRSKWHYGFMIFSKINL